MQIKGPITIKKGEDVSSIVKGSDVVLPFSSDNVIEVTKLPVADFVDQEGSTVEMVKK